MDGLVYHSVEEIPDCILDYVDAFFEDPETHELVFLYEESDPDPDMEDLLHKKGDLLCGNIESFSKEEVIF